MKGAHTKDHKPVAAAGDRDPPINSGLCRPAQSKTSLFSLIPPIHSLCPEASVSTWFCFCLDRTPVSAQLLVALPHLLLSARQPYRRRSAAAHVSAQRAGPGRRPAFYCRRCHWTHCICRLQAACPQHGKKEEEEEEGVMFSHRLMLRDNLENMGREKNDFICSFFIAFFNQTGSILICCPMR